MSFKLLPFHIPRHHSVRRSAGMGRGSAVATRCFWLRPALMLSVFAALALVSASAGAQSWVPASGPPGGLTNLDVRAVAIDPSTPTTLYAGTRGSGVFRSTDFAA